MRTDLTMFDGRCFSRLAFWLSTLYWGVLSIRFSASSKVIGLQHDWLVIFFFWHVSTLSGRVQTRTLAASVLNRDAEASASSDASAACYRRLEDVGVLAVVEPPRKLVQVKRQIFLRDVVGGADDATLEQLLADDFHFANPVDNRLDRVVASACYSLAKDVPRGPHFQQYRNHGASRWPRRRGRSLFRMVAAASGVRRRLCRTADRRRLNPRLAAAKYSGNKKGGADEAPPLPRPADYQFTPGSG